MAGPDTTRAGDWLRWMQVLDPSRGFLEGRWVPAVDVYRTGEGWLLKFELAGVDRGDVEIALVGNLLTVSGRRRDRREEQSSECHRMEISYSSFSRSVELPGEVEGGEVLADCRDGMLVVRLRARRTP